MRAGPLDVLELRAVHHAHDVLARRHRAALVEVTEVMRVEAMKEHRAASVCATRFVRERCVGDLLPKFRKTARETSARKLGGTRRNLQTKIVRSLVHVDLWRESYILLLAACLS